MAARRQPAKRTPASRVVKAGPSAQRSAAPRFAGAASKARARRLEQELRTQTARLEVMAEVAHVISISGDLSTNEMLEQFMDIVLRSLRAEHGSILLCDDAREALCARAARLPAGERFTGRKVSLGAGIAGWVAEHGQGAFSEDVSRDPRFRGGAARSVDAEPRGILCVPLQGKRGLLGVVEVRHPRGRAPFTMDDLRALEGVAGLMGVGIENARLFRAHDEEIRRREALTSASSVVNSTLDLRVLLGLVMDLAAQTLRAEASSILLKDKATGDLLFDVATGEAATRMRTIRIPRGQGIAGHVAESGRSLLVADCSKDPRFFGQADEKSHFVTRNLVAVPLVARDQVIGVVEVLNRRGGGTFSDDDLRLLQALAHQSAVAIQNAQLFLDLQESFVSTVKALAQAVDAKDSYTAGHSNRVTGYAMLIAEELGLDAEHQRTVRLAGLLHDVGKIGVRDSVLGKVGKLDDDELAVMRSHPAVGECILRPVAQLADVIPGVLTHHERFDGGGYPKGLRGEEIPLLGRILGVADAFDAMTSDRVYRPRLDDGTAVGELKKHSGTQFDARVVKAFLAVLGNGLVETQALPLP